MANKPNPTAYHAHAHFNAHSLYMYYIVWRFEAAALHADFYATRTLARLIATSTNKIRAHPPQSENKNGPKRRKKDRFPLQNRESHAAHTARKMYQKIMSLILILFSQFYHMNNFKMHFE